MAHGVAVNCGIVERRQIDRREHVARNHAPVRGLERNGFDVRNRRNALLAWRRVHERPPTTSINRSDSIAGTVSSVYSTRVVPPGPGESV